MFFFISTPGSMQGQSSSPVITSVGTLMVFILSTSSNSDGRRACTPRMVSAAPSVECSAQLVGELLPAAPIAILVLHAGRAGRVGERGLRHRQFLEARGGRLGLGAELRLLAGARRRSRSPRSPASARAPDR